MVSSRVVFRIGEEGLDAVYMALRQKKKMEQQNRTKQAWLVPAVGAALGAEKAHAAGSSPVVGALRGGVGLSLGMDIGGGIGDMAGAFGGTVFNSFLRAIGQQPVSGNTAQMVGAGLGRLGGMVAGSSYGFNRLTRMYDKPAQAGADAALNKLGLDKEASIFDTAKSVGKTLTTPIPGTKPWLLSAEKHMSVGSSTRPSKLPTKMRPRNPFGNTYDVSAQAKEMGL